MVVALTQSPQPPDASTRTTSAMPAFLADELVPLLAGGPLRWWGSRGRRARLLGAELRRRGLPRRPRGAGPGTFGNLMLLSGSFAFTDIGEHDRGPSSIRSSTSSTDFRACDPGRPGRQACS